MHEVEVKAALKDTDALVTQLAALGCELGPEIVQRDRIFVQEVGSIDAFLGNVDFLRIREEQDRTLFTFKHNPDRASDPHSAPLELELAIDAPEVMEQILLLLGFTEAVQVTKRRRKGRYQQWEVCVDDVEGLGSFVELEQLIENKEERTEIQARMKSFLESLGIAIAAQQRNRYDILLLEKQYVRVTTS